MSVDLKHIEQGLLALLPHRPPMLLLNKLVTVEKNRAEAQVQISPSSSFFVEGKGVPSWIGIEYMGQTAALIAGLQLQQGLVAPHLGFLLGTRKYRTCCGYFKEHSQLLICCSESAIVGDALATFDAQILDASDRRELAAARLSVYRKFDEQPTNPDL